MRVLICGSRDWDEVEVIDRYIQTLTPGSDVVIHGAARGVDSIAGDLARQRGVQVEVYPAQWHKYGRGAGPARNKQMLSEGKPNLVVYFHRDLENSKGTINMIDLAIEAKVKVVDGEHPHD